MSIKLSDLEVYGDCYHCAGDGKVLESTPKNSIWVQDFIWVDCPICKGTGRGLTQIGETICLLIEKEFHMARKVK